MKLICFLLIFAWINPELIWAENEQKNMVEAYHQEFMSLYLSKNQICLDASDGEQFWDQTRNECVPCENKHGNIFNEKYHICLEYFITKKMKSYEVKNRECWETSGGTAYYDQEQGKCSPYELSSQTNQENGTKALKISIFNLTTIVLALILMTTLWTRKHLFQRQNHKGDEPEETIEVAPLNEVTPSIKIYDQVDAIITEVQKLEKRVKFLESGIENDETNK